MSVVNCIAYAEGHRTGSVALDDISNAIQRPDQFVWIGLHEPGEELLKKVQEEFGLHELAVEDAHRAHQRPKLERYGESVFIVLRTVAIGTRGSELAFGETHLFVGPRYVVSVRHGSSTPYVDVRGRCESAPAQLSQGPGFVLYALMDFVVDQYFPVVDALEEDLEELEDEIFQESFNQATIGRIYQLKRKLLDVKRWWTCASS